MNRLTSSLDDDRLDDELKNDLVEEYQLQKKPFTEKETEELVDWLETEQMEEKVRKHLKE